MKSISRRCRNEEDYPNCPARREPKKWLISSDFLVDLSALPISLLENPMHSSHFLGSKGGGNMGTCTLCLSKNKLKMSHLNFIRLFVLCQIIGKYPSYIIIVLVLLISVIINKVVLI